MNHSELPVDALVPAIIESVRSNPITLLEARPGAGKTTRVPAALLDAGYGEVIVLEPRRIAARMAARRVAEERGEPLGETVGYQVRFEEETSAKTRLRFVTEGVLTRRLLRDRELRGVRLVVLDEFHERHLETDLALALLRTLETARSDLRLLIMSATLGNRAELCAQLGGAPLIASPGRQYPLDVRYQPGGAAPLEEQVSRALQPVLNTTEGHVLVFLPGAAEIRRAMDTCAGVVRTAGAAMFPLHGDLTADEQDRAVALSSQRKVIFSTNVAESSVTIEGVRTVIDSGLARVASWSPWSGISRLRVEKISRSSATQRAGRAARTAPGVAIRLYSEEDFLRRPENLAPELQRADLSQMVLQLAAAGLGLHDLLWLEPLPQPAVDHAADLLRRLGALDQAGRATNIGKRLASLPVHPRLAMFLLEAHRLGAIEDASKIAALLSEGRLRFEPGMRRTFASDFDLLLELNLGGNARRLQQQIVRAIHPRPEQNPSQVPHALEVAMLRGYPDRVARRRGETLLLANGSSARLDRASAVSSEFLCAIEIEERPEQGIPTVRIACPVQPDWLLDTFPDRIETREAIRWNREAERVEQVSQLLYDALVIDESVHPPRDGEAAADLLVERALEAGAERFAGREDLERFLNRLRFAAKYQGNPLVPETLVRSALTQLAYGLRSFGELRQAAQNGGLQRAMETFLPMAEIEELAPSHVRLPSGRRARIEYPEHQPPYVASRLQDFFGLRETPRVARGEVPVVVHLLAPNQRPVQVTEDLRSFWKNLYPQVRRELSRRYPRHKWPENPEQPE